HLARHDVRIDVVGGAVVAIANGRDHRDELVFLQGPNDSRFDTGNIAHETDVKPLARVVGVFKHFFSCLNEAAVFASQANRLAARFIDHHHDILLDLATQDPFNHFHGFGVGHAHALDKTAFLAHALKGAVDLRATTMHDHGVETHQAQQHDVVGKMTL